MSGPISYRARAVNTAIQRIHGTAYVEIGVKTGKTFKQVVCQRKIGIDPVLQSWKLRAFLWMNRNCRFFNETSDAFFAHHADKMLEKSGIDVAFIDGLHTYDQTIVDVQNVLKYLNQNGVIYMHDCNPADELAAYPSTGPEAVMEMTGGKPHAWNGDVWKTIVHLRSVFGHVNVFVLDCDHGIGVITRGENKNLLPYTTEDVQNMTYKDLEANRSEWLNLKDKEYLWQFLENYPAINDTQAV